MNDAVRRGRLVLLVSMVALEGRWEEKKKRNCFQDGIFTKEGGRSLFYDFLSFSFSFLVFGFWFFYCRVTRVARGVLLWTLGWVGLGLGLGLYTTWGKVLPSTGLQVHVTFFIDEMGGGMEGRAASGRLC